MKYLNAMLLLMLSLGWLAACSSENQGVETGKKTPANSEAAMTEKREEKRQETPVQPLPDFAAMTDVKAKKQAFFDYFYPLIVAENKRILAEREKLLSATSEAKLKPLCEKYSSDCDTITAEQKQQLLRRVDVVPPALALAQAAKESGWGTSRFARKGNNFFGQWCFSKGCGLVPSGRSSGANHEVRKFESPRESVRAYLFNLNTGNVYQDLRKMRQQARQQNKLFNGEELAEALLYYSERREAYVKEVKGLISYNKLSRYDERFWQALQESH